MTLNNLTVAVPGPENGDGDFVWLTQWIVPADPAAPPALAALRARVSERIAGYAAPRSLVLVPALPMLPSGKPDLAALRALDPQETIPGTAPAG